MSRTEITPLRYMLREMAHTPWSTVAVTLAILAASALLTATLDLGAASVDATRVLMKDMGFNLLIMPPGADPARWQALNFSGPDMPEGHVKLLAGNAGIMAQHFVGKLQQTMQIDGVTVVLTGVQTETVRTGTKKKPMPTAYTMAEGKILLGAAAARALGKKAGDTVTIAGGTFEVERVLDEYGAVPEDIRIFAPLGEVQALLGKPGRINAIDALACQCPANVKDIVSMVRESILRVLPDATVQPYYSILLARHEQRVMMLRVQYAVLAAALAAAAAAVWGLAYQNVTGRRREIGVLRALGVPDRRILALFLGKLFLCGVLGGVAGVAAGRFFYFWTHPAPLAEVITRPLLLCMVAGGAPLLTVLFGLPPILSRLLGDANDALGEGRA